MEEGEINGEEEEAVHGKIPVKEVAQLEVESDEEYVESDDEYRESCSMGDMHDNTLNGTVVEETLQACRNRNSGTSGSKIKETCLEKKQKTPHEKNGSEEDEAQSKYGLEEKEAQANNNSFNGEGDNSNQKKEGRPVNSGYCEPTLLGLISPELKDLLTKSKKQVNDSEEKQVGEATSKDKKTKEDARIRGKQNKKLSPRITRSQTKNKERVNEIDKEENKNGRKNQEERSGGSGDLESRLTREVGARCGLIYNGEEQKEDGENSNNGVKIGNT